LNHDLHSPGAVGSNDESPPALMITQRLLVPRAADDHLILPFDIRSRSRFRAYLMRGDEVGVMLGRGQILRGGDLLLASDGRIIEVGAAAEFVTTLHSSEARQLARAAYHLGNRHVALQIGDGWLRYSHDHVLDEMARGLGLAVTLEQAPFEPEGGAYSHPGHSHGGHGHPAGSHGGHSHGPDHHD
jgi:urease accessory protein